MAAARAAAAAIVCAAAVLLCAAAAARAGGAAQEVLAGAARAAGAVRAGAAKLDGTLPEGTPLAGYNHGARRVKYWPLPEIRDYTTFMTGSTGALNPTWVKAVVVEASGQRVGFITIDGIGADGTLTDLALDIAQDMGLQTPRGNIILSASHTHSGPGAISPEMLWALAPATDLLVPELQKQIATTIAKALVQAEAALAPASIGIVVDQFVGVTENRRAHISPYVTPSSIDPNLAVVRLDDAAGKPIATIWNYAMHGTCFGPDNMKFSSDIMGGACDAIEKSVGGVALFLNADAGDIDPTGAACNNKPNFDGAPIIAGAVAKARAAATVSNVAHVEGVSQVVEFGVTDLNVTLARFDNCSSGGPLDICTICSFLRCDLNAHLPDNYVEDHPRFTAFRFDIGGVSTVLITMPGEPLLELGWWARNATKEMGFDQTILAGYTNSHMGYFATPNEYDIGGYESQLTFWGIDTAQKVLEGATSTAKLLA